LEDLEFLPLVDEDGVYVGKVGYFDILKNPTTKEKKSCSWGAYK
jgi:hypothetical protein